MSSNIQYDPYQEVYKQIANLPSDQVADILKQLLTPQELFMKMDGTSFVMHKYGLRMFEAKALLEEVGIPEDDPRSAIYRSLLGSKIDEEIPKALRAIAAKEETVGKNTGAIQVWDQGVKVWWVPIAATSKFTDAMNGLISEFEAEVDGSLLNCYSDVRRDSVERFEKAAGIAWDDMDKLGKAGVSRSEYVSQSVSSFESRFPTEADIREKIRLELSPRSAPLPQEIENILSDVRTAAREKYIAEAENINLQRMTQETQLRMVQLEEQLKQSEVSKIEDERRLRREILREKIAPEIEQAQGIVLQFQSGLMRVAQEIIDASQTGAEITPATRRSWKQRLGRLKELTPDNPALEEAIQALTDMSTVKSTNSAVQAASGMVSQALDNIEKSAHVEMRADALWQLIRAGQGEEAIKKIQQIRSGLESKLNEVDALFDMSLTLGAKNTPPVLGEKENNDDII